MTKTTPVELEPLKPEDLWSDEICALVDAAFETVSRNPSDYETVVAYRRAIAAALTRTLPQSLMIPNAISAIKRQVDDRERDKLEGHLAGTYISLSPEQAKEIVQFFEHRGAHEGTAAMRRALRSARGWLNVIAQDRPDGSDIHRVLDDVDAALAAIAHTQ